MAVTEGTVTPGDTALIKKKGTLVPVKGSSTAKLDTAVVTQTDGTVVNRSAVIITDPEDNAARGNVVQLNSGKYAQLVQDSDAGSAKGTLEAIYEQNERIIMMLESIAE